MGYAEKNLITGESIVFKTGLHVITLLRVLTWGLFLLLCAFFAGRNGSGGWAAFFVILALVASAPRVLDYFFSEFVVTNKRVLLKHGFLRTRSFELVLAKVESIAVDQSLFGKVVGYGKIVVIGTGGSREPFDLIDGPIAFRRCVQEQIERSSAGAGTALA
jgi:uncharacterized membrane protein YdbT with pleckstrin-like domain